MDKLINFENLSNRSFSGQVAALTKNGHKQLEQFHTLLANGLARCFETNDTSHVNKLVSMALAVGRYRAFSRIMPGLVPYAFDKEARLFSGKQQSGKMNKLNVEGESGAMVYEEQLIKYIKSEQGFAKTAPKTDWSLDDAILRLVKTAHKNGADDKAVTVALEKAIKKAA